MRQFNLRIAFAIILTTIIASFQPLQAQAVDSVAPSSALVGAPIQLNGSGFDPGESYTLHFVGGATAASTSVTPTSVDFSIPAGARSGPLELEVDSSGLRSRLVTPVTVLRMVSGQIDPALSSLTSGYALGTVFGDPNPALLVPVGEPGFVFASGPNDDDPALIAVTGETANSVTLDALSTASALVLMNAKARSADSVETDSRLTTLTAMTEVQALAALIDGALLSSTDYLDAATFDDLYVAAVDQFIQTLPGGPPTTPSPESLRASQPPAAGSFEDGIVEQEVGFEFATPLDLPPAAGSGLPDKWVAVKPVAGTFYDKHGKPFKKIRFESQLRTLPGFGDVPLNPLDWLVAVYEIDPFEFSGGAYRFPSGGAGLSALTQTNDTFARFGSGEPIGYAIISQESVADDISIFKFARELILGEIAATPDPTIAIAADRPGLYIARAVSGAYWPDQIPLILALPDGIQLMASGVALNATLLGIDYASIVLPVSDVIPPTVVQSVVESAYMAAISGLSKGVAKGDISRGEMVVVMIDTATAAAGAAVTTGLEAIAEQGAQAGWRGAFKTAGKSIAKILTVVDAVGSYGKAGLRESALFNTFDAPGPIPTFGTQPIAATVESAIIALGDPWAPVITGIEPLEAHRGATIRLRGRNFSYTESDHVVEFATASGTVSATPTVADETSLQVVVPVGADELTAPIRVTTPWGSGSSATIQEMQGDFRLLADPLLTAVDPPAPITGQSFRLQGVGFSSDATRMRVRVNSPSTYDLSIHSASETEIFVSGLFQTGLHDVDVLLLNAGGEVIRTSPMFSFNSTLPPSQNAPNGMSIPVTSLGDDLAADDQITLREAMRWASEGLGFRAPSMDEQLLISGTIPPAQLPPIIQRDTIYFPGFSSADVIVLNPGLGPLPNLSDFDEYFAFNGVTVDGSNMAGDGFTLDLVSGALISGLTIQNFGGDCLLLKTATDNIIENSDVNSCGGNGIRVEDASSSNRFTNVGSTLNTLNGLSLTGGGTQYNTFEFNFTISTRSAKEFSDNGEWGVLVDGGATFNQLHVGDVRRNGLGGMRVLGSTTTDNVLGYPFRVAGAQVFMEITDNVADGVLVDASRTTMRYLRVGSNDGDGILLEGAGHSGSQISSCSVGFTSSGAPNGNLLSGIHLRGDVSAVRIGEDFLSAFNVGPPNEIGANGLHGIWLEGSGVHEITVDNSRIGASMLITGGLPPIAGNAQHGIAITDGSHHNLIGNANEGTHLEIVAHTAGAGIYIDGPTTTNNVVIGNQIGNVYREGGWTYAFDVDPALGNLYGVQITNQAWDNMIGRRGWFLQEDIGGSTIYRDSVNYFYSNFGAGILVESGSDPTQSFPPEGGVTPRGANVIQNNFFGTNNTTGWNEYHIILRGPAFATRIGGSHYAESNGFRNARKAAIWIDGVVNPNPSLSNRIINNSFLYGSGWTLSPDPLDDPTEGIGILVTNSTNQLIGGSTPYEQNNIARKAVAIHIDQSDSITVQHNTLGLNNSVSNSIAGLILSDSTNCTIGPGNQFLANGRSDTANALGGLAIYRGGQHRVFGNFIGTKAATAYRGGNQSWGILVRDSADNLIGGAAKRGINVITSNVGDGIRIDGAGSTGNRVTHNSIGIRSQDQQIHANTEAGVRLLNGATGNMIGGNEPLAFGASEVDLNLGNVINGNGNGAIVAEGATTSGNSYLNNSITNHATSAIQNLSGANGGIAPPTITMIDNRTVIGTTSGVATGSRVQLFSDGDDEGEVWVGEGWTLADGSFTGTMSALHDFKIRAAVTDALSGSTSELGTSVDLDAAPTIALDGGVTLPTTANNGSQELLVLPLTVQGGALSVQPREITLRATGSLYDPMGISALNIFEDSDGDGQKGAADRLLAGPVTFAEDDGSVTLSLDATYISADSDTRWLVTLDLASGATVGTTVGVEIVSATDLDVRPRLLETLLPVSGSFPIAPAPVMITAGSDLALRAQLTVSSDPIDFANFIALQAAVDTASQFGASVRLLAGINGEYNENVVVNASRSFSIDADPAAILNGTTGTALRTEPNSAPIWIRNLTIRGDVGIEANSRTVLDGVQFEMIGTRAVDLVDETHQIRNSLFSPGMNDGVRVGMNAAVEIDATRFSSLDGIGVQLFGSGELRSSLLHSGSTAIRVEPSGSLLCDGCTIADQMLVGIDLAAGGMATIQNSLLWDNVGGDLLGGSCAELSFSLSASPNCAGLNDNLSIDPSFVNPGVDFRLNFNSPALDVGIAASSYTGQPCSDLDGAPRLRDADGDGFATVDLGAYEWVPTAAVADVTALRWSDASTLEWDLTPGATEYHVYRSDLATLGYASFGDCRDDLDGDRTDTTLTQPTMPPPGEIWFYIISADDGVVEGSLGLGSCAERSRFSSCP